MRFLFRLALPLTLALPFALDAACSATNNQFAAAGAGGASAAGSGTGGGDACDVCFGEQLHALRRRRRARGAASRARPALRARHGLRRVRPRRAPLRGQRGARVRRPTGRTATRWSRPATSTPARSARTARAATRARSRPVSPPTWAASSGRSISTSRTALQRSRERALGRGALERGARARPTSPSSINDAPVGQPPMTKVVTAGDRSTPGDLQADHAADARARLRRQAERLRLAGDVPVVAARTASPRRRRSSSTSSTSSPTPTRTTPRCSCPPTRWARSTASSAGGAGHPVPIAPGFDIIDRSYVTIVGIKPNTQVTVKPSWRIKGNPPIAGDAGAAARSWRRSAPSTCSTWRPTTPPSRTIPRPCADLSGTLVEATQPVAVFSGTESAGAPGAVVDVAHAARAG